MTDRTFHRIAATIWYALLIAMFLLAYRCKAQIVKNDPLKCEQYQHEEKHPGRCVSPCDFDIMICTTECLWIPPEDKCVDDIHVLTEREWQTVKQSLPQQHHGISTDNIYHPISPKHAPPVRPATSCRVWRITGHYNHTRVLHSKWEPCADANEQVDSYLSQGFYAWVDSKIEKVKDK